MSCFSSLLLNVQAYIYVYIYPSCYYLLLLVEEVVMVDDDVSVDEDVKVEELVDVDV